MAEPSFQSLDRRLDDIYRLIHSSNERHDREHAEFRTAIAAGAKVMSETAISANQNATDVRSLERSVYGDHATKGLRGRVESVEETQRIQRRLVWLVASGVVGLLLDLVLQVISAAHQGALTP